MNVPFDNVRLVDGAGRVDSSWHVPPGDRKRTMRALAILADYRREEPHSGWHLETRGTYVPWHRWEGGLDHIDRKDARP